MFPSLTPQFDLTVQSLNMTAVELGFYEDSIIDRFSITLKKFLSENTVSNNNDYICAI